MDYLEIQNIIYEQNLGVAIREAFPIIYGVPGSWANIMDFVDEYEEQNPRYHDTIYGEYNTNAIQAVPAA